MKIDEVRKNDDGQLEIRLEGQEDFNPVADPEIAAYCVYLMLVGPEAAAENNSMIAKASYIPERLR